MEINSLPLPESLISSYAKKGITSLYPPQAECIDKGLLDGKNLLISIPTASGKTLLAEMAMWTQIAKGGKCLYIVPLRALAAEKYDEFSNKGIKIGIATGDLDRTDSYLGKNDIIVATSEKVDSLLRNRAQWLSHISLMVLDEIHLIGAELRGITLEMVITKMRYTNPHMQVIGLSATIGNPRALASWLDADLITSSWRPVDLRQGVYYDGKIRFGDNERQVTAKTKHDDLNLCLDTIEEGGQCLVFVSSRRNAEAFAKRAASALKCGSPDSKELAERLKHTGDSEEESVLAACVERGAAFHHAGLRKEERSLIEEGFRKGFIEVISATPTLAAGLNLPARRVIIRDYMRFTSGLGMVPIPVMEYHQMAGRAGRPHLDPYGESVLISKDKVNVERLFDVYINADAEEIESQCTDEESLFAHILSVIATGFTGDRDSLINFMDRTFYAHQHPKSRSMTRLVDDGLRFLFVAGMIKEPEEGLYATRLGSLVSQLYLDPRSAQLILDTLSDAIQKSVKITEIGILHLICCTIDMPKQYLKSSDTQLLKSYLYKNTEDLIIPMPFEEEEEEIWYRALKTALVLMDWIEERSEALIADRFGIGPGDIFNVVDSAKWLLHAADRLTSIELPDAGETINSIGTRVKYGIKSDLLPLVQIKNIGRVRARRLYNAGMVDGPAILTAGLGPLSRILGQNLARAVIDELQGNHSGRGRAGANREQSDISDADFDDLTSLPTIGLKLAEKLKSEGIQNVTDLLKVDPVQLAGIIGSSRSQKVLAFLDRDNKTGSSPIKQEFSGQSEADLNKGPKTVKPGQQSIIDFS